MTVSSADIGCNNHPNSNLLYILIQKISKLLESASQAFWKLGMVSRKI